MQDESIKQIKLSSGDEIICQVVEFPEKSNDDYIIRNVVMVSTILSGDNQGGNALRPWLTMVEQENQYVNLNQGHIVAICTPNINFVREYISAQREMRQISRQRDRYYQSLDKEIYSEMESKLLETLEKLMSNNDSEKTLLDSADLKSNVVPFRNPNDDTIH